MSQSLGENSFSVLLGNLGQNSTQQQRGADEPAHCIMTREADPVSANEEKFVSSEGRFSYCVLDQADDSSAALSLRPDGNRTSLSLVVIVERTFLALGLSSVSISQRSKRLLFWFWIIWFFCRGISLIVLLVTEGSTLNPDTYVCNRRSTMISPRGFPNRDAQSSVVLLDYFGWLLIYLSSFSGRYHSHILFYCETQTTVGMHPDLLFVFQLELLPPPLQPS
jgi:hypothetical protein